VVQILKQRVLYKEIGVLKSPSFTVCTRTSCFTNLNSGPVFINVRARRLETYSWRNCKILGALVSPEPRRRRRQARGEGYPANDSASKVPAFKTPAHHQQPEVNYLPRFGLQLISLERSPCEGYHAREIDFLENLDIVHITLLVAGGSSSPRALITDY
jgi:hypothetical protein